MAEYNTLDFTTAADSPSHQQNARQQSAQCDEYNTLDFNNLSAREVRTDVRIILGVDTSSIEMGSGTTSY